MFADILDSLNDWASDEGGLRVIIVLDEAQELVKARGGFDVLPCLPTHMIT